MDTQNGYSNEFGKVMRNYRIDNQLRLKDVADMAGISSAFLSAIECGRKPLSTVLAEKMMSVLNLDARQKQIFQQAIDRDQSPTLESHDNDDGTMDKHTCPLYSAWMNELHNYINWLATNVDQLPESATPERKVRTLTKKATAEIIRNMLIEKARQLGISQAEHDQGFESIINDDWAGNGEGLNIGCIRKL